MVRGFSLRGLSDVMTTTSASSLATSPISGRLARSRSPPAPNTTITRPGLVGQRRAGELARRLQSLAQRRRCVGEVDQHRKGWPSSTASKRPRTGATAPARRRWPPSPAPSSRAVVAAATALAMLNRPPILISSRRPRQENDEPRLAQYDVAGVLRGERHHSYRLALDSPSTRRAPHRSARLTTARETWSAVNSYALAAK